MERVLMKNKSSGIREEVVQMSQKELSQLKKNWALLPDASFDDDCDEYSGHLQFYLGELLILRAVATPS